MVVFFMKMIVFVALQAIVGSAKKLFRECSAFIACCISFVELVV
ncbi:hypothetical protein [Synechococcus sp. WH 8109]|nr:hypothetical protein [Synechococcus sp. WH 8109]